LNRGFFRNGVGFMNDASLIIGSTQLDIPVMEVGKASNRKNDSLIVNKNIKD